MAGAARPSPGRRRVRGITAHLCPQPVAAARAVTRGVAAHALPKEGGAVVAVTGAAGYIGSWLVVRLLEKGHTVRACVRDVGNDKKVGHLKALPEMGKRLSLHSADMTKEGAYDEIFEGVQVVFHAAEVFMSFGSGTDREQAKKDFGISTQERLTTQTLYDFGMRANHTLVGSINKSSTVKRLIYTSSVAAMSGLAPEDWARSHVIDETREPAADVVGPHSYAVTKRASEHFFAYHASISGGRWSVIVANPSDIVGPVLAPHQAAETWQGKIAGIIQGIPAPQEGGGRPWWLVDSRDVADAEILLAESTAIQPLGAGPRPVVRNQPFWLRVHLRNDKVCKATGMRFRAFDDTLYATVESLVQVGGVAPRLK